MKRTTTGISLRSRKSDWYLPYLLIAPTVILISVFMAYPVISVFHLSFKEYTTSSMDMNGVYVGLQNFKKVLFGDKIFSKAAFTSIKWVLVQIVVQTVLGLLLALLLNTNFKGRGAARSVIFIPWAVSGVLTSMLWTLMYNQHVGVINDLLNRIGIISNNVAWLSNPKTVFTAVSLAEIWRGVPYFAITLLAGLQSIPSDVFESADVDGCGALRKFWYITLPHLKETLAFSVLLRCIWEFNSVDLIFTMTNGGPLRLTTTLPVYLMQTAIVGGNYGYGSAMAVVMFLALLLFVLIYLKITKYGQEEKS